MRPQRGSRPQIKSRTSLHHSARMLRSPEGTPDSWRSLHTDPSQNIRRDEIFPASKRECGEKLKVFDRIHRGLPQTSRGTPQIRAESARLHGSLSRDRRRPSAAGPSRVDPRELAIQSDPLADPLNSPANRRDGCWTAPRSERSRMYLTRTDIRAQRDQLNFLGPTPSFQSLPVTHGLLDRAKDTALEDDHPELGCSSRPSKERPGLRFPSDRCM